MNIYVGSLSPSVSEETLRQLFEKHGDVTSVKIMKDKFTQEPRGFGFIEMPNDEEAQKAMATLNGYDLEGQKLRVNQALPQEKRSFGGPRRDDNRGGYGSSQGGYRGGSQGGYRNSSSGNREGGYRGGSQGNGGYRGGNRSGGNFDSGFGGSDRY